MLQREENKVHVEYIFLKHFIFLKHSFFIKHKKILHARYLLNISQLIYFEVEQIFIYPAIRKWNPSVKT